MGNWAITIEGLGCHHNGPEAAADADKMAKAFTKQLLDAGHSICDARFTVRGGQDQSIVPVDMPLVQSGASKGYVLKSPLVSAAPPTS